MATISGLAAGPELVIFDCDGVLVDSEILVCRVDAACLTEAGFPTAPEEVAPHLGQSAAIWHADVEARHGRPLPPGLKETIRDRLAAAFEEELEAIPGVAELVDTLALRKCVASGSHPDRIRRSLRLTGLLDRFEPHIFSATQAACGKPAPDVFLFAADQMGVKPSACLVIEDSVPGVHAAVAAGMPVIGFVGGGHCPPGHAARLTGHGAAAVVQHIAALIAMIGDARLRPITG